MKETEAAILAAWAWYDQASAEVRDPRTTEARREELYQELRDLLRLLKRLERNEF